jgi:hypothetical protein
VATWVTRLAPIYKDGRQPNNQDFEKYGQFMTHHCIDGAVLRALNDETLKACGVQVLGHRLLILCAIHGTVHLFVHLFCCYLLIY